jgi:hypothetical protein
MDDAARRLKNGLSDVRPKCRFYYFFVVVVVIGYETTATARRALTFIIGISVNDTFTIAIWASFHVRLPGRIGLLSILFWTRVCACAGQHWLLN